MAKRFNLVGNYVYDGDECISHFEDTEHRNEIVDKMNELAEENQSWLKTVHHFDTIAHKDRDYAKRMHKENKELKQSIKEVLKLLEEEVDLFSDKATEHDIQAYIELQEFDNKDAYYIAVSTKKAIKILKEMIE